MDYKSQLQKIIWIRVESFSQGIQEFSEENHWEDNKKFVSSNVL